MKNKTRNLWKSMLVMTASGSLLATTCSDQQLQAFSVGFNAFVDTIDNTRQNQNKDEDISFGDWLLDELDDL